MIPCSALKIILKSIKIHFIGFQIFLDFVDKKNGSNEYKNEIRFQLREEKREVINSSKGKGIINPRLGSMDYETYDILEKLDEDKDLTMQNLYDAIDEVEGFEYKSVINKGNEIYVVD